MKLSISIAVLSSIWMLLAVMPSHQDKSAILIKMDTNECPVALTNKILNTINTQRLNEGYRKLTLLPGMSSAAGIWSKHAGPAPRVFEKPYYSTYGQYVWYYKRGFGDIIWDIAPFDMLENWPGVPYYIWPLPADKKRKYTATEWKRTSRIGIGCYGFKKNGDAHFFLTLFFNYRKFPVIHHE